MENFSTRTLNDHPAAGWFAAAGTFFGRVWSAVRAFRNALHQESTGTRVPASTRAPDTGARLGRAPWLERGELPESYGRTEVVAMVVSPYLMHVYWDLAPEHRAEPDPAVLRFHDAGEGGSFDVPIELGAKNWYVHLWSPHKRYFAELGLQRNGAFVPLARSNTVETPRAWPVANVSEQFSGTHGPSLPSRSLPGTEIEPSKPVVREELKARAPERAPDVRGSVSRPVPAFSAASRAAAEATPRPAALVSEIHPEFQGPPSAPAGETRAEAPATPAPTSATEVLRQRLAALYGFRHWTRRLPAEAAGEVVPRSVAAGAEELPRVELRLDLTARVENEFTPGLSSVIRGGPPVKTLAG